MAQSADPGPALTLDQGAIELNEFYEAYLRAGFEPRQALYLVGCLMTNSPGVAPPVLPADD